MKKKYLHLGHDASAFSLGNVAEAPLPRRLIIVKPTGTRWYNLAKSFIKINANARNEPIDGLTTKMGEAIDFQNVFVIANLCTYEDSFAQIALVKECLH